MRSTTLMVILQVMSSYGYGLTTLVSDQSRVIKGGSWNDRAYWLSPGTVAF
jgi:sulfatase modifying factor 1